MHRNSELLFKKYAMHLFKDGMRILEIGPDKKPSTYEKIINNNVIWQTLDLSNSDATYIANSEYVFPIPDNTFDIVLSGQVIEYVRKIWVWIKKLSRICKRGGFIITINPVNWPLHEAPYDCWRIYPEGMRTLYEEARPEVICSKKEALDFTACKGIFFYRSSCKKLLVRPLFFIRRSLYGFQDWRQYLAEDTITIGKKL